jgi:hypothetical protein
VGVDAEAFTPFLFAGQCLSKNGFFLLNNKSGKLKQQPGNDPGN